MLKKLLIGALGFVVLAVSGTAQAGVIVSPDDATASSTRVGQETELSILNTIDQSGLSTGFTSGVTDYDTYLAGNPLHSFVAVGNEWFAAYDDSSPIVTYDMGAVGSFDSLALWNEDAWGNPLFDLMYSTDGINWSSIINDIITWDNPSNTDYAAQRIDFGGDYTARYFQFVIHGCAGEACSIGEVAFSRIQVPEPATLALFGIGLAGIGFTARRRRKAG